MNCLPFVGRFGAMLISFFVNCVIHFEIPESFISSFMSQAGINNVWWFSFTQQNTTFKTTF